MRDKLIKKIIDYSKTNRGQADIMKLAFNTESSFSSIVNQHLILDMNKLNSLPVQHLQALLRELKEELQVDL